jgi:hypothetical protein
VLRAAQLWNRGGDGKYMILNIYSAVTTSFWTGLTGLKRLQDFAK